MKIFDAGYDGPDEAKDNSGYYVETKEFKKLLTATHDFINDKGDSMDNCIIIEDYHKDLYGPT